MRPRTPRASPPAPGSARRASDGPRPCRPRSAGRCPSPTISSTVATPMPRAANADMSCRGEVQPGGGGGHRVVPVGVGVDRLVALGVGERRGDVRRQGHLAAPPMASAEVAVAGARPRRCRSPSPRSSPTTTVRSTGRRRASARCPAAAAGRGARAPPSVPGPSRVAPRAAAPRPRRPSACARCEPGRQHPGGVDHDQVAGLEQVGQIGDPTVLEPPRAAIDEQPGRVARLDRHLGDALVRQLVVEARPCPSAEPRRR